MYRHGNVAAPGPGSNRSADSSRDARAEKLRADPIDVIGCASTTSAYVIGFDAELAMASWLAESTALPVAATCASAALEAEIGRPVLTSNQVLLWQLLAHVDVEVQIDRYG